MASPGANHVMSFVASSEKYRSQFLDKWEEVIQNFIVQPQREPERVGSSPYRRSGSIYRTNETKKRVILKDGETHKVVMTYVAILMTQLFAHPRNEYVTALPVGWEDSSERGPTVTKLLRYVFSLPGHFRTFVETLTDTILVGTSVIESPWSYEEKQMIVRTVSSDMYGEQSSEQMMAVPSYDDIKLRNIDVLDFYPDPAHYRIQDSCMVAKKFRMTAYEARKLAAAEIYDKVKVEEAIRSGVNSSGRDKDSFRKGLDQPLDTEALTAFQEMTGYEGWGEFPDDVGIKDQDTKQAFTRGVVTVLNGIDVRSKAWPLADPHAPFHTFIINPVQGRFYGISPAEVIRYDQSFADALKMLLAEAVIRQVHPPIAYDSDAEFDTVKLRAWQPDIPIPIRGGPSAIGTLRYDANVANGFAMMSGVKVGMQEDSGALGALQGQSGPDRESATVGSNRYQYAKNRPELAAMVIEKECLPPLAQAILRRYQQFLGGIDDLKSRVGELPEPAWLGDIMGDFDIQFVGSRLVNTRQDRLQAYDRMTAMALQVPTFAAMVPWADIGRSMIGDVLDLPEVAVKIADPGVMAQNMAMMQQFGPGGAQNGVANASEPPGMMPAQAAGGPS